MDMTASRTMGEPMKHNPNYLYMFFDGMPCIGTDKQEYWIFSKTSGRWRQSGDNWDAVYPTDPDWWRWFEELPELPGEGQRIEKFLGFDALGKIVLHLTLALQMVMKQTRQRNKSQNG